MKVLYAIQGTGNGHLSRAREIIPLLKKQVDHVDLLVSGQQYNTDYPYEIKYRYAGLTFRASNSGKVSYFGSILKFNLAKFIKEVRDFPADDYDLIITDFEPVSAWSAKLKKVPCVELSHQFGVVKSKPKCKSLSDCFILMLMKYLCPSDYKLGFHFLAHGQHVFKPVIRREIRQLNPENKGHYTVYLPGYSNEYLIKELSRFPVEWHIFTKVLPLNNLTKNLHFRLTDNHDFLESLRSCEGVLCGAGFELPAEAMYLKKKVMLIPLKGQFEQQCNAIEAEKLGANYIHELSWKFENTMRFWLKTKQKINIDFEDETEKILQSIIDLHRKAKFDAPIPQANLVFDAKAGAI